MAILFYITASCWAWFEYQYSQKKYWLILIGIFAGCAVLVKWLVGLLIYAMWIVSLAFDDKTNWRKLKGYFPIATSLFISILIFIPWQFYVLYKFPLEARYEFHLNAEHFFHSIENHSGNFWFHFNAVKDIYGSGDLVPFLLLSGLFVLIKNSTARIYRVAILSAIFIIYGFYTIASTKMTSFCIIVSPFAFIGWGALTDAIIKLVKTKIKFNKFDMILRTLTLIVLSFFLINLSKIQNYHTDWKPNDNFNRKAESEEMKFIRKLPNMLQDEKYVVFNTSIRPYGYIPVMFYTNYIAYGFIPNESQIEIIKGKAYKIAILDLNNLPDYIVNDKDILKIKLNSPDL
jgi:4-amino-4-deoxy-L-arabinose transferase